MSTSGIGGAGKTGTPDLTKTRSLKKTPSLKKKTTPLLDRKEDNVLGDLFAEQEKPKIDPSQMQMVVRQENLIAPETRFTLVDTPDTRFTLVNDKKPESDPSQMQMVVSQYRPENMQMVVAQPQTQAPKPQGFFSKLKTSFKSGLAKGMKVAAKGFALLSRKLDDGANKIQASIATGRTVEATDVQAMNQEFKNLDSVVRVTHDEIQEQGTKSHQDKMSEMGKSISTLSSLLESLTKMCVEHTKQMSVPVPSNNSGQLKIEEVKDDTQGKDAVPAQTSQSYHVTMPENKIEDKQETSVENKKDDNKTSELSLNPEIPKKLMAFKEELSKIVLAFMELEKEIAPLKTTPEKPKP